MDYYYKEFDKLQKEFHEVMHDYPLFKEDITNIEEKDIKEINELLDKKDEFYFKKAIDKLKDLIEYIKTTSTSIEEEYHKFDKSASTWENIKVSVSQKELDLINSEVKKANLLIKCHRLKDLKEANKIMDSLIKRINSYK